MSLGRFALLLSLLVTVTATAFAVAESPSKKIGGWGEWSDPDGDCDVKNDGDALLITVPGKPHDLWPENPKPELRTNAPRVLRDVEGDFTVQVKAVDSVKATKGFRAATLLIWQDDKNFVRLDDACTTRPGQPLFFAYYHVFTDGKRTVHERKEDIKDAPTWLRLQRKGDEVRASFSQQDPPQQWEEMPAKEVKLPTKVKVGVAALNFTSTPFIARFEEFQLLDGSGKRIDGNEGEKPK